MQQKETLAKSEEELNEEEVKIRADVEAADELLKEATAKLNSALETKPSLIMVQETFPPLIHIPSYPFVNFQNPTSYYFLGLSHS